MNGIVSHRQWKMDDDWEEKYVLLGQCRHQQQCVLEQQKTCQAHTHTVTHALSDSSMYKDQGEAHAYTSTVHNTLRLL